MAHCAHCAVPEKSNQNKEAEEEEERRERVKGPTTGNNLSRHKTRTHANRCAFLHLLVDRKVKQSVEILVPVWPAKHTAADSSSADGHKRQFMAPIRPRLMNFKMSSSAAACLRSMFTLSTLCQFKFQLSKQLIHQEML